MSDDDNYFQLKTLMECRGNLKDPAKYVEELQKLTKDLESSEEIKKIIKLNKALSERHRLVILELLLERDDMCICELTNAWGFENLSQPTISHHIQKLEEVGLIEGIKSGKFVHYRIKDSKIQEYLKILEKYLECKLEKKE